MKILKIKLRNLASISHAELDFTKKPLSYAPLILISGPTGSGKSTLLDAVCLSFYGKAPRFGDYSQSRKTAEGGESISSTLNLVRLDSQGECFTEVEFEANNGRVYTAQWLVQFNTRGKHKGEPSKVSRVLIDNESGEKTELSLRGSNLLDNQEYIGLTYDQFKRTTLLAQGEFDRFMKGDTKEKCEILERLVGVEMFSLYGERIKDRATKAKSDVEIARKAIEGIKTLSESELKAYEEQLSEARKMSESLGTLLKEANAITTWYSADKTNRENLERAETTLKEAAEESDTPEAKNQRELIKLWDGLAPLRKANERIATVEESLANQRAKLRTLAIERASLALTKQAIDSTLSDIAATIESITDKLNSFSEADRAIIDNISLVKEYLDAHCEAAKKLSEAQKAEKTAREAVDSNVQELARKNVEERTARKERLKTVAETVDLLLKVKKFNELSDALAKLEEAKNIAVKNFDEAEAIYKRIALSTENAAKTLRSQLVLGQACPVCGTEVSNILRDEVFEKILEPLKADLAEAQKVKTEAETAFNEKQSELKHAKSQLPAKYPAEGELADKVSALSAELEVDAENAKTEMEAIEKEIALIAKASAKISALNTARNNLDTHQGIFENAAQKLAEYITLGEPIDYEKEKRRVTDIADSFKQLTDNLASNEKQQTSLQDISAKVATALNETAALPSAEAKDAIKIEKAEDAAASLKADFKITVAKIDELTDNLKAEKEKRLEEINRLTEEYKPYADNPTLGQTEDTIKAFQETIKAIDEKLTLAKGALKNAQETFKTHSEKRPDTDLSPEQAVERETELNAQKSDNDQNIGSLSAIIETDRQNKKTHQEALIKLEALEIEHANWEQLNKILGGDKFKQFVCSEILSHMIGRANHYFKMFQTRYEMLLRPGGFEIMVYDNELKQERVFSTLSGGETFMVSLSLALGLAALNKVKFSSDTLFIDEGFGTLSSECLDSVMDSLDLLRKFENRRVLVISHVDMLRDRIPVQINLRRNGSRSTIDVTTISH